MMTWNFSVLSENMSDSVFLCACLNGDYLRSETAEHAWRGQMPGDFTSTMAQMSVDPEIYLTCPLGKNYM